MDDKQQEVKAKILAEGKFSECTVDYGESILWELLFVAPDGTEYGASISGDKAEFEGNTKADQETIVNQIKELIVESTTKQVMRAEDDTLAP